MSKKLWIGLAAGAVIAIPAAYAGGTLYVGHEIEQRVSEYREALVANPDIQVSTLRYESTAFGEGLVHYDIAIHPAAISEQYATISRERSGEVDPLELQGSMPVEEGPLIDGRPLIARTEHTWALPEQIAGSLSSWDGSDAVEVIATVGLTGTTTIDARIAGYQGMVEHASKASPARADFQGAELTMTLGRGLDSATYNGRMPRFLFEGDEGAALVENVTFDAAFEQHESGLWLGRADFSAGTTSLETPDGAGRIDAMTFETTSGLDDGDVTATSKAQFDAMRIHEVDYGSLSMDMSMQGVSPTTWKTFSEASQQARDNPQAMQKAFMTMLAEGPRVAINEVVLRKGDTDVFTLSADVAIPEVSGAGSGSIQQIINTVEGNLSAELTSAGALALARANAQAQAIQGGRQLSQEALDRQAEQLHSQWLQSAQYIPLVHERDGGLYVDASVRDGMIRDGDQQAFPIGQLF
ncbi:DUF945 family protein [Aquisalimonas lutea]|uniref:DUF945 family protein n=1 Tax=Aquisalimonas lutea TaxID=1327750 RepID=UPI0025B466F0|nr:DUF945 family protein [Aquisalimonas lutea]MDN3518115.1 DUF945 family protein [Aquisalimonas lutea]